MKSSIFYIFCVSVSTGAFRANAEGDFDLCSESLGNITTCIVDNCPEQTQVGTCIVLEEADTCADVESICQQVVACCGNNCADSVEAMITNCVPGEVCEDITCSNGSSPTPPAPPTPSPPSPSNDNDIWSIMGWLADLGDDATDLCSQDMTDILNEVQEEALAEFCLLFGIRERRMLRRLRELEGGELKDLMDMVARHDFGGVEKAAMKLSAHGRELQENDDVSVCVSIVVPVLGFCVSSLILTRNLFSFFSRRTSGMSSRSWQFSADLAENCVLMCNSRFSSLSASSCFESSSEGVQVPQEDRRNHASTNALHSTYTLYITANQIETRLPGPPTGSKAKPIKKSSDNSKTIDSYLTGFEFHLVVES